jgi:hypothetical protein
VWAGRSVDPLRSQASHQTANRNPLRPPIEFGVTHSSGDTSGAQSPRSQGPDSAIQPTRSARFFGIMDPRLAEQDTRTIIPGSMFVRDALVEQAGVGVHHAAPAITNHSPKYTTLSHPRPLTALQAERAEAIDDDDFGFDNPRAEIAASFNLSQHLVHQLQRQASRTSSTADAPPEKSVRIQNRLILEKLTTLREQRDKAKAKKRKGGGAEDDDDDDEPDAETVSKLGSSQQNTARGSAHRDRQPNRLTTVDSIAAVAMAEADLGGDDDQEDTASSTDPATVLWGDNYTYNLAESSFFCLEPDSWLRRNLFLMIDHAYFERVILSLIVLSMVSMVLDTPVIRDQPAVDVIVFVLEIIFTVLFTAEMVVKMLALGLVCTSTATSAALGTSVTA